MAMSSRGVVASGHYLATEIGIDVLRRGGNAIDAAAAVGFALNLLQPHQCGLGGEVPVLLYQAKERRVRAISGHGTAPRPATLEQFAAYGLPLIPGDGFLPAVVPPVVATWILALQR
ncbi:MAG: gamma-glutamyltransferase, partial [Armatimonadota bacterium]|nr:gamma-glutamyltransferase [Armatimonadota bacterium]